MTRLRNGLARDVLVEVEAEFVDLLTSLGRLARTFVALVAEAGSGRAPQREELAALREAVHEVLDMPPALATGAGVIAPPRAFSDHEYWLEWWWTTPAGTREALRVNLDEEAPDFFDYASAPWFVETVRTGRRRVTGPFVDYECTNAYSLTVSTPAHLARGLTGIAAADVLVSDLERRLMPGLCSVERPVALTNQDGRVIASNSADWAPGLLAPEGARRERAVASPGPTSPLRSWYLVDVGSS